MNIRIRPLLFAVLIVQLACSLPATNPATQTVSLPGKAAVLDAIAVIEERLPDESASDAMRLLMHYASESDDVVATLSTATTPWMRETGELEDSKQTSHAHKLLLAAYIAGNVKSQLQQTPSKPSDDPRAGWLTVIRVHERLAVKNLGAFLSVQRLAQLERAGLLEEYAEIIKQEIAAAKKAKPMPPVSAKERLTRDYLDPAHELTRQNKFSKAYAIYDAWLEQNPDDAEVHFNYAFALNLEASAAKKNKVANAAKKAARPHIFKALIFGSNSPLLPEILVATNPKGKDSDFAAYSDSKKAHDYITRAEKAFSQRRFDDAIKEYKQALKHDPKSYIATLYIGDCYYAQGNPAEAIPWFEKAIAINPNRETAHRYMADALLKSGKQKEGIAKHIDALIAEPANRLPRSVMQRVAQAVNPLFKPSPVNKLPVGSVSFDPKNKKKPSMSRPKTNQRI
ncbi:tetratricopeptide repeat protein [Ereboglobus luteus]|uniref:Tetratricopeptide repeat protein n=1 Tax=Ereboglobus luteus TaxID=1796921 RepID=A0A2U8E2Z8_9BACT|nr:tetratricopeptide repeat protein [Ereboglobus luteus]AWI09165.1 hypothetical protein CKA38_07855 [Ereboglobus luteus]